MIVDRRFQSWVGLPRERRTQYKHPSVDRRVSDRSYR